MWERGKWQPTPIFLSEKSHGQRSLELPVVHRVSTSQMLLNLAYLSLSGNAKTLWLLTYSFPPGGFSLVSTGPSSLGIPNSSGPPCVFSFIHLPGFPLTFPFLSSLALSLPASKYLPPLFVSSSHPISKCWCFPGLNIGTSLVMFLPWVSSFIHSHTNLSQMNISSPHLLLLSFPLSSLAYSFCSPFLLRTWSVK